MNEVQICLNSWRIHQVTLPPVWAMKNLCSVNNIEQRESLDVKLSLCVQFWITYVELWFDMIKYLLDCRCLQFISKESLVMCLHLVTSFGVCVLPMCPCTVHHTFKMRPYETWTYETHMRVSLRPFSSRASSRPGLHIGYEKNLTSRGSARNVQSNIIWCLTPLTTLKRKCWELVCVLLQVRASETVQDRSSL